MNLILQMNSIPHFDASTFGHRIDAIKNAVADTWMSVIYEHIDSSDVSVAFGRDWVEVAVTSKDYNSWFDMTAQYSGLEDALAKAIDTVFLEPLLHCDYCGGVMYKREAFNLLEASKDSADKHKTFCKTCEPIVRHEMVRLMASRDVTSILESSNTPKIEEEKD